MKYVTAQSDHKEDGNHETAMARTTAPFAENRYSKYRFERESIVRNAPECSGVYGLYRTFWIFIGEAENIRTRLLEHLASDNPCVNQHRPLGFAFELVCPEERLRRLAELINELQPTCKEAL